LNVVKTTLRANYYGTLEATQSFIPLLKPAGRVVNVASVAGKLNKYSPTIRNRFLKASTVAEVTTLMEEFTAAVARGKEKEEGWPSAAYAVSKAGTIAFSKVIAAQVAAKAAGGSAGDGGVLVNSCCPGWVATDMTRNRGYKTPDQGAQTPVMLAIENIGGKYGRFWQNEKEISWAE
jgi:carbonyl reductase 1